MASRRGRRARTGPGQQTPRATSGDALRGLTARRRPGNLTAIMTRRNCSLWVRRAPALVAAALWLAACTATVEEAKVYPVCGPGKVDLCACPEGSGRQTCLPDGSGWGDCDCTGGEGEGEGEGAAEGEGEGAAEGEGEGAADCPLETILAGSVEVFAHEASRPDAGAESSGEATGAAPCSRPGVLPWVDVTRADALAACEAVGFRLCTREEWKQACGGRSLQLQPYGWEHDPGRCNDRKGGAGELQPTGAYAECVSPDGAWDMVGNVWEWVSDLGDEGQTISTGWSWKFTAMSPGATPSCDFAFRHAMEGYFQVDLGFRCCRDAPAR